MAKRKGSCCLIIHFPEEVFVQAIPIPPDGSSHVYTQTNQCARRKDKLLFVMTMVKLGLVRTKMLLFVNSIEAGFRLRLFLESFGIRTAVVNAELPLNSRHHILQVRHRHSQAGH